MCVIKVSDEVIERSLQEINIEVVENSVEDPEEMIWQTWGQTEATLSVLSDFKQKLYAQSSDIIMPPMTCKNIKINIKQVKKISIKPNQKTFKNSHIQKLQHQIPTKPQFSPYMN